MTHVLIIDNNITPADWGATDLVRSLNQCVPPENPLTCTVRRAPHEDLPKDIRKYTCVVISGSLTSTGVRAPWIKQLDSFILRLVDFSIPTLGICYGFQAMARALGGQLGTHTTQEIGWTEVFQASNKNDPLLKTLPSNFWTFSNHHDEVLELPPGFQISARSDRCAIQAAHHEKAPLYGIQFHPEKTLQGAQQMYLQMHKKGESRHFLHAKRGYQYYDPLIGKKIFKNFLCLESM